MIQRSATLTPAFGRRYRGRDEALRDWEAGKDFLIHDLSARHLATAYCSIRDVGLLKDSGITHLTFANDNGHTLVNVPIARW